MEAQDTDAVSQKLSGKFLTFFLAEEEYGIQILKVQEIIGMMAVTTIPRTPEFILGVINLRGKIIPVVDLRRKLAMPEIEVTEESCIIVVRTRGIETGVLVDRVSHVMDINASEVDESPDFGDRVDTGFLLGIGRVDDRARLLLNIDRVLSDQDAHDLRVIASDREEEAA